MHMNIVCTCILYMYGTVDNVFYVIGNYMPTMYMYVRDGRTGSTSQTMAGPKFEARKN